jgi:redox-sensitive bicupin YhaK (pirin superfamily)
LLPYYASTHFNRSDRLNKLLQIASGQSLANVTRINQDANIFVSEIEAGQQVGISQLPGRQIYLACLEGVLNLNKVILNAGDAIKVRNELDLSMTTLEDCHLVLIDMPEIIYNAGNLSIGQNNNPISTTE